MAPHPFTRYRLGFTIFGASPCENQVFLLALGLLIFMSTDVRGASCVLLRQFDIDAWTIRAHRDSMLRQVVFGQFPFVVGTVHDRINVPL